MAYGDFKDLKRRTFSDKVLRGKAFNIAKNPKYDAYQRGLASMVYKSLRVTDEQLFKKCNKIWRKVEKLMRVDCESKPTYGYDDKDIKTKIKTYTDVIITNFHNKKLPKEKVPCKCLSIVMLDSVIESDEKCYPHAFSEECKYVQEKIKFENYINEELDSDSDNDE